MRGRTRVVTIAVAIATIAVAAVVVFGAGRPSVGSQAPEFTLKNQEGQPSSLEDFRGKWVVLYFYPANTETGRRQAQNFQRDLAKYAEANAVVVGVSVERPASNKDFATRAGLTFPLLSDPGADVADEYDSTQFYHMTTLATRNTFLLDPQGRVAQVFLDVDADRHSTEVLGALEALRAHRAP